MTPDSKKLFNVLILGISFMFIFTAFQTCGNIAQTVITNLNSTDFHGSGYTSLYIAVFIQPSTWSFYTASVFIGIAAAVLWTAQGNCLTINSDENTIGRNSGVFWALLQSSLFFGNLYIYFAWQGKTYISESDRRTVFIALTVISLVGTVLFFLIRKQEDTKAPGEEDSTNEILGDSSSVRNKLMQAVDAFKRSIKLSFTKEILLLSVTTAYTGLELTFFSGVYGTCIGAVNRFGIEQKSLIGLSGIFIGVGEILGGGIFGLLSKKSRFGRNPIVMLGIIVHFIAFYLIFVNMPSNAPVAPMEGTDDSAYMIPSKEVAIFCSFLLGLGDSCFNTQLLSILGFLYSEDSAPAFAIFKFVQSICAAVAYFYSNYFLLQWQLLIMVVVGFFGTITFFAVEWKAAALLARGSDYSSI
ncbi:UNC93-like protein MFSD11 isoform X2 [Excalfactoria chinensis]|uniref:UNC93-like protein MFSD11 isoform X2 n=1 Tax=Excalfactoria chinensis TaxID=46218 RepID=UPI003B3B627F